jgi:hypothetical protein
MITIKESDLVPVRDQVRDQIYDDHQRI